MSSSIYVASKTTHAATWRFFRDVGYPIISTWIDEAGEGQTADYSELAVRCISEAATADATVLYCESGEILKGAIIEAGAALAAGKQVWCIGDCPSISRVFRKHPNWRDCESIDLALSTIMKEHGHA